MTMLLKVLLKMLLLLLSVYTVRLENSENQNSEIAANKSEADT